MSLIHPRKAFPWVYSSIQTVLVYAGTVYSYAGNLLRINKCTIRPVSARFPTLENVCDVQLERNVESRRRALIIGVAHLNGLSSEKDRACDRCPDYDSYRRTHVDAIRMRDLITQHGYEAGDIRVLLDDGEIPALQPTKANVEAGLRWLIEDARPGDRYFFYFAGHGDYDSDDGIGEDETTSNGVKNNSYVDQDIVNNLFQRVTQFMPAGSKLTALFDCCHSGTAPDNASTNGPHATEAFISESVKRHKGGRLEDSYIYTVDPRSFSISQHPSRDTIPTPQPSAEIISISACLDSKLAHETMGGWLTESFVKTLRTRPGQTYRDIFSGTSTRLNYFASRMNQLQDEVFFPPQIIYLYSQRPLNLDHTFAL
ncbi:hypothetical protein BOTBODRAFT_35167 [Botryobasidium botryosum FD-172 SS1]|uniref:Peptidase C14 caspase domain-containing protein n=1 Tax=Botryobasidium botryosum (strain FD-172 SS1) TaxID=930990 RepID=A0A067M7I3_BOTB1|nr:hypothetical protein BOTBODRAFT_35167 [Botryobasidium botryosum FD-172 SS1]